MTTKTILYDNKNHLNELLKHITKTPETALDNFEEHSMFVKQKNSKASHQFHPHPYTHIKTTTFTDVEEESLSQNETKSTSKEINHYIDDILIQANAFEQAGIGFNSNEWYKIRITLKKLLIENNCETVRFFGKIYGIESDYYVIMGILKDYPMQNLPVHIESRGNEGINFFTFWVSDSLLESWYELPDITHEQMTLSRKFKYIFTGNLNSKVKSFIQFPGKEMHLLKCQIVRILHSSFIVPKEYLRKKADLKEPLEDKITEFNDEYIPPPFEEMISPESWMHEFAYILPNGKIIDQNADPETAIQVERLKSIAEDEGFKVFERENEGDEPTEVEKKYWTVKVIGDQIKMNKGESEVVCHAVILVENGRWPGSYCVWKNGKFCNLYIGFGYKNSDELYYPTQLKNVEIDPDDIDEQPEPNPEKEPVVPEPDTEGEPKEGEEGQEEDN